MLLYGPSAGAVWEKRHRATVEAVWGLREDGVGLSEWGEGGT